MENPTWLRQCLFYLLQVTSISCLVTNIDCNWDVLEFSIDWLWWLSDKLKEKTDTHYDGKYCCGLQAYFSKWAAENYSLLSLLSLTVPLPKMDSKKSSTGSAYIARYLQEQNHSSEEEKEVESLIDDFEPFVVGFVDTEWTCQKRRDKANWLGDWSP